MRFLHLLAGLTTTLFIGFTGSVAHAEASIFELRITNDTDTDLTFRLHDGKSKHAKLKYDGDTVSSHKIKAGTDGIVGIQPTGKKCAPNCGGCTPTIGKVYAYYEDDDGNEQRNNYYQAAVEFFEYCGVAGSKSITTYTSNWTFDHGTGKGTGKFSHDQKSSHNSYTKSDPAQGLTVDGKYISGHATITYSQ